MNHNGASVESPHNCTVQLIVKHKGNGELQFLFLTLHWWRDYISNLPWSRLGVEPAELSVIAENREVLRVLGLLIPRSSTEKKWG